MAGGQEGCLLGAGQEVTAPAGVWQPSDGRHVVAGGSSDGEGDKVRTAGVLLLDSGLRLRD